MSTEVHDSTCDTGRKCFMCLETDIQGEVTAYMTKTRCCPDCDNDDREQGVTIPTFDTDWQQAPRLVRRLITEADAEWFWLKGEQAGRIAEQVETQRWLAQVMAGYDERVSR